MTNTKAPVTSLKEKRAKVKVAKDASMSKKKIKELVREGEASWKDITDLSRQWANNFIMFQQAVPGWATLANHNDDKELTNTIRVFALKLVKMNRSINAIFSKIPTSVNLKARVTNKQVPLYLEVMNEYQNVIFGQLTDLVEEFEELSAYVAIYMVDANTTTDVTEA